jgi:hypothetical protein
VSGGKPVKKDVGDHLERMEVLQGCTKKHGDKE